MLQEILHGFFAVSNHIMSTKAMTGEVESTVSSTPSLYAEAGHSTPPPPLPFGRVLVPTKITVLLDDSLLRSMWILYSVYKNR